MIQEKFNVICKDIQYQEGIFEQIEKNNDIDVIIISSILPGTMRIERVIEKIKEKILKIRIILILEKKNEMLEDFLYSKGVYDIYYDNEVDIDTIVNLLRKTTNKKQDYVNYEKEQLIKEINSLKQLIKEKESDTYKIKNINECKVICIYGINGIGKTIISVVLALNFSHDKTILIISKEYKLIKKINFNKEKIRENIDICESYNIKDNLFKYDYIIMDNPPEFNIKYFNILIIGQNLYELVKSQNLKKNNLKIIINKLNRNSIDENTIEEVFNEQDIIGRLSFNNAYDKLINSQYKYKIENNNKVKKEFGNIIKIIDNIERW